MNWRAEDVHEFITHEVIMIIFCCSRRKWQNFQTHCKSLQGSQWHHYFWHLPGTFPNHDDNKTVPHRENCNIKIFKNKRSLVLAPLTGSFFCPAASCRRKWVLKHGRTPRYAHILSVLAYRSCKPLFRSLTPFQCMADWTLVFFRAYVYQTFGEFQEGTYRK